MDVTSNLAVLSIESFGDSNFGYEITVIPLYRNDGCSLEQGTGIEPASEAWEATIIADIRTLHRGEL